MGSDISIECSNCGFVLQNVLLSDLFAEHNPCPRCGAVKRSITLAPKIDLFVNADIIKPDVTIQKEISLGLEIQATNTGSRHKKHRLDYESKQGKTTGRNGRRVYKKTSYNRQNPDSLGSYIEKVIDGESGNIIVEKQEKLSDHNK